MLVNKIFFPVFTKEKSLVLIEVLFMLAFAHSLFPAFVHKNCVESARLYLRLMLELSVTHPRLNKKFADKGLHVVSISDRF